MSTFVITCLLILAVVAIMAIGVLFGRRPITGSCGGLALLGLECDCETPCPRKRARMATQGEQEQPGTNGPPGEPDRERRQDGSPNECAR
jgi:hypothetical protein